MSQAKKNIMIWISLTIAVALLGAVGLWQARGGEARQLLQERGGEENFVVLDVRTPGEFAAGHLAKAQNIDSAAPDFSDRLQALDKAKSYLVYCRTGNRSRQALRTMGAEGFGQVYHLSDGVRGWQNAGYALER